MANSREADSPPGHQASSPAPAAVTNRFPGRGRRLGGPTVPSAAAPGGPLSAQNIRFLRQQRFQPGAQGPRFFGLRHTTSETDRDTSARRGPVARPGFHGDAYAIIPSEFGARPELARRATAMGMPQISDEEFNTRVNSAIQNSINWDVAQLDQHTPLRDASEEVARQTHFAIADMGGGPRTDRHDRYGASTAKFGTRTVVPQQVSGSVFAEQGALQQALRARRASLSAPLGEMQEEARGAFTEIYGQQVNQELDRMRNLHTLNAEPAPARRERMAAAAELRQLQQQGRGRPSVRATNREREQQLRATVNRPPGG